jgi:small subunit ribosomal protein S21e
VLTRTLRAPGENVDLYIPRKCAWTNRLITAKDHASIQLNIGHLDDAGVYTGQYTTFALSGFVRAMVRRGAATPATRGSGARVCGAGRPAAGRGACGRRRRCACAGRAARQHACRASHVAAAHACRLARARLVPQTLEPSVHTPDAPDT